MSMKQKIIEILNGYDTDIGDGYKTVYGISDCQYESVANDIVDLIYRETRNTHTGDINHE